MLGPFEVFAKARRLEADGRAIVHLELGESDFDTPEYIKDAAIAAIRGNDTHYAPAAGIPELRQAVAEHAARLRGIDALSPDDVVIGPGVKPLLFNVLSMLLDPGDEIVFADPAYPTYFGIAQFLRVMAVPVALDESDDFRFDLARLEAVISARTKVLLLNSPHNPTGSVLSRSDLEAIAELVMRHNLLVVSDEIYSHTLYDGEFASIAALDGMRERAVVLDGFSKTFAMTGWRLGYAIAPRHLAKRIAEIAQLTYSSTATFVQRAGITALRNGDGSIARMLRDLRLRRDAMVAGLNAIPGFRCRVPRGAFYAFPNVSELTDDDTQLAETLLHEASVAVLPGSACGSAGRGHLRFSYGASLYDIERAISSIRATLEARR